MSVITLQSKITCAVEIFIATALLHQENPEREDFTMKEIMERAREENLTGEPLRSGVSVHASLHCVANRPPNPGKHKMLFATGRHTRRLLMPTDEVHPGRDGNIFPERGEVPVRYYSLLEWAKTRYEQAATSPPSNGSPASGQSESRWLDGLYELDGLGSQIWQGIEPDDYVRQLREDWQ